MDSIRLAPVSARAASSTRRNSTVLGDPGLVIALMGETGSGKSTFINTVLGNHFMDVGNELHSCTTTLLDAQVFVDGQSVRLIDTPGFSDTYLSDTEVLRRIASYLVTSYGAGIKLSGIIYLHKLTNDKMVGGALKNLQMFRKLVGRKGLKNVILASTKASEVTTPGEANYRHEQLRTIYWKDMIDLGSDVCNYDGQQPSALAIVRSIMRNHPTALQIQKELVDDHKDLLQTEAGAELNAEVLAERQKADEAIAETKRLQEEERVEMKREREEERRLHLEEQAQLRLEAEAARRNDKKVLADLLEKQMAKEREVSEEREKQWRLEQEDIRRQNARELARMQAERDSADRRVREQEDAMARFREDQEMNQRNLNDWQRQQGYGDNSGTAFFAWAAGIAAILPLL